MSDTTDDTQDDQDSGKKNWRRDLEDKLAAAEKRAEEAESKQALTERTNAFKDAGLDLSFKTNDEGKQVPANPLHQLFAKSWDGKNDVEAIKASASETGVLTATTQPNANQSVANQHASVDRISVGADSVPPSNNMDQIVQKLSSAKNGNDKEAFWAELRANGLVASG